MGHETLRRDFPHGHAAKNDCGIGNKRAVFGQRSRISYWAGGISTVIA